MSIVIQLWILKRNKDTPSEGFYTYLSPALPRTGDYVEIMSDWDPVLTEAPEDYDPDGGLASFTFVVERVVHVPTFGLVLAAEQYERTCGKNLVPHVHVWVRRSGE